MKKFISVILAFMIAVPGAVTFAVERKGVSAVGEEMRVKAFPTAEGGGMYVTGARGALEHGEEIELYHVTNLNDSGAGSFRDAVSKGNRMIVFDVSGYIDLQSRVSITHDNITILGQTAPENGVCLRGNSVKVNGKNIIMRYLRFRVGSKLSDGTDTITQDGLGIPVGAENIIIDHCSISWGTDENLSIIGGKNITVQWSIVSEALNQSIHEKGEHSYAGIWGGRNVSMHHNLIASHKSRNPKIGTSETVSMTPGYTDKDTVVDMWNNVIYNWGDKAGYGAENGANVNIVNNYYKPGPATPEEKRARIFELSPGNKYQPKWSGDIYANGNYIDDDSTNELAIANAAAVNAENWQIDRKTGVYLDAGGIETYHKLDALRETSYLYNKETEIQTAQEAYVSVLADVGAVRKGERDLVDARIIDNVTNRTAPAVGSHGSKYLLDDPLDGVPEDQSEWYDERGYPLELAHTWDNDSDRDGLPDVWEENVIGLDKNNPHDSLNLGPGGYTWMEIYAESKVAGGINSAKVEAINYDGGGSAELSVQAPNLVKVEFYDGGRLAAVASEAKRQGTAIVAQYENDRFLRAETQPYDENFVMPESDDSTQKVFIWDSLSKMRPGAAAAFKAHADLTAGMNMLSAKMYYADGKVWITPVTVTATKQPAHEDETVSGDFDIVGTLENIPNIVKGAYTGIYADDFVIAAGYNENFKKVIKYGKKSNAALSEKDDKGYKYIKISVRNGHADLFAAATLADWVKLSETGYDYKGENPKAGTYVIPPADGGMYEAVVPWRVISGQTEPEIVIDSIEDKARIGFEETIRVTARAQEGSTVNEIAVLLNDQIIKTVSGLNIGTTAESVDIPVSFAAAQEGTLKVMCFDSNLCSAQDSRYIYISAQAEPWQIADIGMTSGVKTYMFATDDYTYKISGPDGCIGGLSDTCGYVYQKFMGDNRIYYRSRMQDGKQFGIMLRKSLEPDSEAYFFGGDTAGGSIRYSLKSRNTKGAEMAADTVENLSGSNLYFIAEKTRNTLNIYQTENGSTVYTTKTLLKSIDVSSLGEEYYMGFASVYGGKDNSKAPDAGWIGIDNSGINENGNTWYNWNFDYGLDWCWQMQESNVLRPSWTNERVGGVSGGKMVLAPDDGYTGNRYVFREYQMADGYVPLMSTDVMLTGEEPALNLYLQTGNANTAYKITFDSDYKIKDSTGKELGTWISGGFYHIDMRVGVDTALIENNCRVNITDAVNGEAVSDTVIPADSEFRTQINTEKKTPVTKAVYFEPVYGANGTYYIGGVSVVPRQDEYKIVEEETFYKFDRTESYAGMTITGGIPAAKNKKIGGIQFTHEVRLKNGTSPSLTFPVPGDCEITLYASSANSSERGIVINDGTEHEFTLDGSGWKESAGNPAVYSYKGEAKDIRIYGRDGVSVYGVKVSAKRLEKVE